MLSLNTIFVCSHSNMKATMGNTLYKEILRLRTIVFRQYPSSGVVQNQSYLETVVVRPPTRGRNPRPSIQRSRLLLMLLLLHRMFDRQIRVDFANLEVSEPAI